MEDISVITKDGLYDLGCQPKFAALDCSVTAVFTI